MSHLFAVGHIPELHGMHLYILDVVIPLKITENWQTLSYITLKVVNNIASYLKIWQQGYIYIYAFSFRKLLSMRHTKKIMSQTIFFRFYTLCKNLVKIRYLMKKILTHDSI